MPFFSPILVVTLIGESMLPTLNHGDRVLILRLWPTRLLRRGSIVLVGRRRSQAIGGPTGDSRHDTILVKRVVGLPGDTVRWSAGKLTEANLSTHADAPGKPEGLACQIPTGHLFLVGDNASMSIDSRQWGPVPFRDFLGLAVLRLSR